MGTTIAGGIIAGLIWRVFFNSIPGKDAAMVGVGERLRAWQDRTGYVAGIGWALLICSPILVPATIVIIYKLLIAR